MILGSSRVLCRGQDPEARYGWMHIGLPQGKELRAGDGDKEVHR